MPQDPGVGTVVVVDDVVVVVGIEVDVLVVVVGGTVVVVVVVVGVGKSERSKASRALKNPPRPNTLLELLVVRLASAGRTGADCTGTRTTATRMATAPRKVSPPVQCFNRRGTGGALCIRCAGEAGCFRCAGDAGCTR